MSETLTPELMSTVHFLALWLAGVGIYFTAILLAGPCTCSQCRAEREKFCMCQRCRTYRAIADQRPDWSDTQ